MTEAALETAKSDLEKASNELSEWYEKCSRTLTSFGTPRSLDEKSLSRSSRNRIAVAGDGPSLFSQYAFTVAGVVGGSGYAIHRKPPNGLGLMLVAGAAGTMADFGYAWFVSCRDRRDSWLLARRTASVSSEET